MHKALDMLLIIRFQGNAAYLKKEFLVKSWRDGKTEIINIPESSLP